MKTCDPGEVTKIARERNISYIEARRYVRKKIVVTAKTSRNKVPKSKSPLRDIVEKTLSEARMGRLKAVREGDRDKENQFAGAVIALELVKSRWSSSKLSGPLK